MARYRLTKWRENTEDWTLEEFDSLEPAEQALDEFIYKAEIIDYQDSTFRCYVRDIVFDGPPEFSKNPAGWHTTPWMPLPLVYGKLERLEKYVRDLDEAREDVEDATSRLEEAAARLKAMAEGKPQAEED